MGESQGLQNIKKSKYIGCIWTRVVVKAKTKSANHSIFSTVWSISLGSIPSSAKEADKEEEG